MDLEKLRLDLHHQHSSEGLREIDSLAGECISDADLMSSAMYPKVSLLALDDRIGEPFSSRQRRGPRRTVTTAPCTGVQRVQEVH